MSNITTNYGRVLMAMWFLVLGYAMGWIIHG